MKGDNTVNDRQPKTNARKRVVIRT
jgi:hypothetical protein